MTVSVEQEIVGGQDAFVLKLTKLAENSGVEMKTVNATKQLVMLRKRREDTVYPINTVTGGYYPPLSRTGIVDLGGLPQVGGPPGYGSQHAHPIRVDGDMGGAQFRNLAVTAEVERARRSKAELIVGIELVSAKLKLKQLFFYSILT